MSGFLEVSSVLGEGGKIVSMRAFLHDGVVVEKVAAAR